MGDKIDTEQKIYVVDDDPAVRDSLLMLFHSVGLPSESYSLAQEFLDHYDGHPGVLVLDVRMPGMSGLELQNALAAAKYNSLVIIFISGHGDIPMAVQALKSGAVDFLQKPFRDQDLLDRINQALELNRVGLERLQLTNEIQKKVQNLTPRESEVMAMVADGKANKVIALDLNISQRTVELHRAHVMEKMGVRSVAQLVKLLENVRESNVKLDK